MASPWFDVTPALLPKDWSSGTLAFLPKPGKSSTSPADLRPIALLEPTGKSLMRIVAKEMMNEAWPSMHGFPQFAYVPGRGCDDAIERVLAHCSTVRSDAKMFQYSLHQAAAGQPSNELFGGLLLSLDLTKAFDMVNRPKLFSALASFGVSPTKINFLPSNLNTEVKRDASGLPEESVRGAVLLLVFGPYTSPRYLQMPVS